MIAGCEQTIVPGLSTLQCYCSGYAFQLRSSFGQSAHSNLARDRLSLLPCVAKKVLEIASSKHRGFGRFQCTHCMALAVQRRGRSPRNAAGGDRATLNLSKTLCFVGDERNLCSAEPSDCAAPRPVLVQCRPLRFPHARAIPIPLPRFHALGPPTRFFPLAVPTQPCAKRYKIWIWELTRVKCGALADCNHHANIHRAGGNQISQNSAAKHRIPSA